MKKFLGIILSAVLLITGTAGSPAAMADVNAATGGAVSGQPVVVESGFKAERLKGCSAVDVQMRIGKGDKLQAVLSNYNITLDVYKKKVAGKYLTYNSDDTEKKTEKLPKAKLYRHTIVKNGATYTFNENVYVSKKKGTVLDKNHIVAYKYSNKSGKLSLKKKISIKKLKKDGKKQGRYLVLNEVNYLSANRFRIVYTAWKNKVVSSGCAVINIKTGKIKKEATFQLSLMGMDGKYVYGTDFNSTDNTLYIADRDSGKICYSFKAPEGETILGAHCRNGKILCEIGNYMCMGAYTDKELVPVLDIKKTIEEFSEQDSEKKDGPVEDIVLKDENTFYMEVVSKGQRKDGADEHPMGNTCYVLKCVRSVNK